MSQENVKALSDDTLNEVAGGRQSNEAVARDVLNGRYGDGEERIRRLKAAGYDPNAIQRIVNQMVKGTYRDPYMEPKDYNKAPPAYKDPYMG